MILFRHGPRARASIPPCARQPSRERWRGCSLPGPRPPGLALAWACTPGLSAWRPRVRTGPSICQSGSKNYRRDHGSDFPLCVCVFECVRACVRLPVRRLPVRRFFWAYMYSCALITCAPILHVSVLDAPAHRSDHGADAPNAHMSAMAPCACSLPRSGEK